MMSTKATIEIIDRPNLHIHIYEETMDWTVNASISTPKTYIVVELAEDRDEYELSAQSQSTKQESR